MPEIVPDASRKQLQSAIWGQAALDSIIHSDGWRGYNGLVDMGYKKHFRVHHGKHEFARGNCHIKCEFRFHHREEDLSDRILTLLKENPL